MLKKEYTLGARLKALRGNASQSDFAAKIGIKQTSYSAYERGRMEPSASMIVLICKNANVSSDWLLGMSEQDGHAERTVKAEQKLEALKKAITELLKEY